MKAFNLLLQFFLFSFLLSAQSSLDNELIIQWRSKKRSLIAAERIRTLVPALHIDLYRFPSAALRAAAARKLVGHAAIAYVTPNRTLKTRTTPNDPEYASARDNLLRTGFEQAWRLTTGGQTSDGQRIVVAILDAGFDISHPDLRNNLWRNAGEVPGDGLDNDNNGYVDDLHGWDMTMDQNSYPVSTHGTQVTGILGAQGNNRQGLAGTNWNLEMMLFSIGSVANVIEAYGYVLEQRQRYNQSGGREGAFVVATNASFGIEGETCADFPGWGVLYDELGQAGILTAASTANRSWDVDQVGDMPTDCPSDYIIGVTNLGTTDQLHTSAAFGRQSVDMAAPGEGSFTTLPNERYGSFSSTSAAAPFVTGAIALLYATPCAAFLEQVRTQPAAAALKIRDVLLESTSPNPSLAFRTATGGTLNVAEAQRLLTDACTADSAGNFKITQLYPNPAVRQLTLETNAVVFSAEAQVELYDACGRLLRQETPFRLGGTPVKLRVEVEGLPPGWYFLRLTERTRVAEAKFLIR